MADLYRGIKSNMKTALTTLCMAGAIGCGKTDTAMVSHGEVNYELRSHSSTRFDERALITELLSESDGTKQLRVEIYLSSDVNMLPVYTLVCASQKPDSCLLEGLILPTTAGSVVLGRASVSGAAETARFAKYEIDARKAYAAYVPRLVKLRSKMLPGATGAVEIER